MVRLLRTWLRLFRTCLKVLKILQDPFETRHEISKLIYELLWDPFRLVKISLKMFYAWWRLVKTFHDSSLKIVRFSLNLFKTRVRLLRIHLNPSEIYLRFLKFWACLKPFRRESPVMTFQDLKFARTPEDSFKTLKLNWNPLRFVRICLKFDNILQDLFESLQNSLSFVRPFKVWLEVAKTLQYWFDGSSRFLQICLIFLTILSDLF